MERSILVLRVLVIAEWVLVAAALSVESTLQSSLPEELLLYLAAAADRELGLLTYVALFCFIPLWAVSTIGVIWLWRPARVLYAASVILSTAIVPFLGPSVVAAWAAPLEELGLITSGAILALLYFSNAAQHFERNQG